MDNNGKLQAPFPYFGGKSAIASVVWQALGNVRHYIEPFFGSGAVLLARPDYNPTRHTETVNDKDGFISNVWRSLQMSPDEVAKYCDYPVNHADLLARKKALLLNEGKLLSGLIADPDAPYNPRIISTEAKKKLKANIEKVGLLAPIVWNETTGNIVSGHQRIAVLDALKNTREYLLKVAKVTLSEIEEKEQNIFMNNPQAMGNFDLEKLDLLFREKDFDFVNTGFDTKDIINMFGESVFSGKQVEELQALSEKFNQSKEIYENIINKKKDATKYEFEYYLIVVFKDHAMRKKYTDSLGLEDNRFIDGKKLLEIQKDSP